MNPRWLRLGTVAAVLVLAPSCALLRSLAKGFKQPSLTFREVRLSDASFTGMTVNLVYTLKNPNPIGVTLAEIDYALFVEGKQVVAGRPPQGLRIPASGSAELVLPATLKFADLGPVAKVLLTQTRATYKAQGTVGMDTPVGRIRRPLSKEGSFDVPQLPDVKVGTPRISQLTASGATLELPLTITNKNSFPLPLEGLSGALSIAGNRVGSISTGDLGKLTPKQPRQITVPLTFNVLQALNAANALRQGQGHVSFNGEVKSGSVLPLQFGDSVKFVR